MLNAITVELSFEIRVPQARVWKALLEDTSKWWPSRYFGTKDTDGIFFEARPGGRLYEESPHGGLLWYTIIEMDAPQVLALSGNMAPPYGGPATSMLRLELSAKAGGCSMKITDHIYGVVDHHAQQAIEAGWRDIFELGLKSFLDDAKQR